MDPFQKSLKMEPGSDTAEETPKGGYTPSTPPRRRPFNWSVRTNPPRPMILILEFVIFQFQTSQLLFTGDKSCRLFGRRFDGTHLVFALDFGSTLQSPPLVPEFALEAFVAKMRIRRSRCHASGRTAPYPRSQILCVVSGKWVIMEYIHGKTLHDAWPRISFFTAIRLALQMRRFVQALQTVTSPTAGGLVTGRGSSIWLEDYFGVPNHFTPQQINSFFAF